MPASTVRAATVEAVRDLPPGRRFTTTVAGSSMAPALRAGDEVVAVRGTAPGLGDLAVVEIAGVGLVVHRVVWPWSEALRTRGDGSGLTDAPVRRQDVLGTVVEARRDGEDRLAPAWRRRVDGVRHLAGAARHRAWRRLVMMIPNGALRRA